MLLQSIIRITIILTIFLCFLPVGSSASNTPLQLNIKSYDDFLSYNATGVEDKSHNVKGELVKIGDGMVSEIWDDVPKTFIVPAFGEKGAVASIFGENDVYFMLKHDFETDGKLINWVAMQWDTELTVKPGSDMEGMHPGDDMWIFGETSVEISVYGDAISAGPDVSQGLAVQDIRDDLFWERIVINDTANEPDYVVWEIRRAKDTADVEGGDVVFSTENSVHVMMASNVFHKKSDPTVMHFSLSSQIVGGSPIITNIPINEPIDANSIFLQYTSMGFLIGTITYMFVYFPTMYIIKKEQEKEKEMAK